MSAIKWSFILPSHEMNQLNQNIFHRGVAWGSERNSMLDFSCWSIFGWPSLRINLKLTATQSFLQWDRKICRTQHILNKSSQLIVPDDFTKHRVILHSIIATSNSSYGIDGWFTNWLIHYFIKRSLTNLSFFHSPCH